MLAGVSQRWEHALRATPGAGEDVGIMGTMYTRVLLILSYMPSTLASCSLVSQALKGIEHALASSQGLEEEERTARAMHNECIEASRMYRRILDKAATVGWMLC